MCVDGIPANVCFTIGWGEQRCNDAHRGRFACSVGADEAEQITLAQVQLDVANGVHVVIFFVNCDVLIMGNSWPTVW